MQHDLDISIHAPAKGATLSAHPGNQYACISIHAPAKGATYQGKYMTWAYKISIHAPAKGATRVWKSWYVGDVFQSTLPRRERRRLRFALLQQFKISIHAPAKGATLFGKLCLPGVFKFQSTLPRRERRNSFSSHLPARRFQSTLPRRERRRIHP